MNKRKKTDMGIRKRTIKKGITIISMLMASVLLLTSCQKAKTECFQKTDFVMDTVLSITLYGQEDASDALKEHLEEMEEKELSWRMDDSMAARINEGCAKGEAVDTDEDFIAWTNASLDLARKSEGAFDPTIGNLTRLWNIEGEHPVVPAQSEIDACMSHMGYEHINIEETQIKMEEGITLDLGAVGKGIGCDIVRDDLDKLAADDMVSGAVVAIGGSIVVYGEKPDHSAWNVAVQDPEGEDGEPMGVISMEGTHFISTSGDYEKFFIQDGKKYHHILDPATGYPSESGLRSVTIVCDNGLMSDGLSTACFVLGIEKGMALAESYGAEAAFINDKNEVYVTDGLKDHFKVIKDQYTIK